MATQPNIYTRADSVQTEASHTVRDGARNQTMEHQEQRGLRYLLRRTFLRHKNIAEALEENLARGPQAMDAAADAHIESHARELSAAEQRLMTLRLQAVQARQEFKAAAAKADEARNERRLPAAERRQMAARRNATEAGLPLWEQLKLKGERLLNPDYLAARAKEKQRQAMFEVRQAKREAMSVAQKTTHGAAAIEAALPQARKVVEAKHAIEIARTAPKPPPKLFRLRTDMDVAREHAQAFSVRKKAVQARVETLRLRIIPLREDFDLAIDAAQQATQAYETTSYNRKYGTPEEKEAAARNMGVARRAAKQARKELDRALARVRTVERELTSAESDIKSIMNEASRDLGELRSLRAARRAEIRQKATKAAEFNARPTRATVKLTKRQYENLLILSRSEAADGLDLTRFELPEQLGAPGTKQFIKKVSKEGPYAGGANLMARFIDAADRWTLSVARTILGVDETKIAPKPGAKNTVGVVRARRNGGVEITFELSKAAPVEKQMFVRMVEQAKHNVNAEMERGLESVFAAVDARNAEIAAAVPSPEALYQEKYGALQARVGENRRILEIDRQVGERRYNDYVTMLNEALAEDRSRTAAAAQKVRIEKVRAAINGTAEQGGRAVTAFASSARSQWNDIVVVVRQDSATVSRVLTPVRNALRRGANAALPASIPAETALARIEAEAAPEMMRVIRFPKLDLGRGPLKFVAGGLAAVMAVAAPFINGALRAANGAAAKNAAKEAEVLVLKSVPKAPITVYAQRIAGEAAPALQVHVKPHLRQTYAGHTIHTPGLINPVQEVRLKKTALPAPKEPPPLMLESGGMLAQNTVPSFDPFVASQPQQFDLTDNQGPLAFPDNTPASAVQAEVLPQTRPLEQNTATDIKPDVAAAPATVFSTPVREELPQQTLTLVADNSATPLITKAATSENTFMVHAPKKHGSTIPKKHSNHPVESLSASNVAGAAEKNPLGSASTGAASSQISAALTLSRDAGSTVSDVNNAAGFEASASSTAEQKSASATSADQMAPDAVTDAVTADRQPIQRRIIAGAAKTGAAVTASAVALPPGADDTNSDKMAINNISNVKLAHPTKPHHNLLRHIKDWFAPSHANSTGTGF